MINNMQRFILTDTEIEAIEAGAREFVIMRTINAFNTSALHYCKEVWFASIPPHGFSPTHMKYGEHRFEGVKVPNSVMRTSYDIAASVALPNRRVKRSRRQVEIAKFIITNEYKRTNEVSD